MPQRKKEASVRRRTNKASTQATLRRVERPTTNTEAFEALTVKQLQAEIDRRNADGRHESELLNRKGTKAVLIERLAVDDLPKIPAMPDRGTGDWHPQTVQWWADVWASPMHEQWDTSDLHNVYVVALLYDDIWTATTPKARKDALAEYRLQRADLGLSPYSRRRLEWTIETAEEAKARGEQRRTNGRPPAQPAAPDPAKGPAPDPRSHLAAVP